jgi:hypothetical protein
LHQLDAEQAYRLIWSQKFLSRSTPIYREGDPLPHLTHAKEIIASGHPLVPKIESLLAAGDEAYDRAQAQSYRVFEVLSSLQAALVVGKVTAFKRDRAGADWRLVAAPEWGEPALFQSLREQIAIGFGGSPVAKTLRFEYQNLCDWLLIDRMPNEPSAVAASQPRKVGAPQKLDSDYVLSVARHMKEEGELVGFKSKAALCQELSRRCFPVVRVRPNTIEKNLGAELSALMHSPD